MKKLMGIVLIIVMIALLLVSLPASAANPGGTTDEVNWTLSESVLKSYGTGSMEYYVSISSAPWYKYSEEITTMFNYGRYNVSLFNAENAFDYLMPSIDSVIVDGENINITLSDYEAGGVVVVSLMWDNRVKKVVTTPSQEIITCPADAVYNKINVIWLESIESLKPLCSSFECEFPPNSVAATYNEYKNIYHGFFNSLLAENVTDELVVEWVDYTCDLATEYIEADGKELTKESFEEVLPQAMLGSLIQKRKFIRIRNQLIDFYPDAIYELWENDVIHEDLEPWAEVVRALVFKN